MKKEKTLAYFSGDSYGRPKDSTIKFPGSWSSIHESTGIRRMKYVRVLRAQHGSVSCRHACKSVSEDLILERRERVGLLSCMDSLLEARLLQLSPSIERTQ